MSNQNALLSVRGLTLEVIRNGGAVVKDVSFDVSPGEIVGIVGESGSGKTLATRSIIGLIAPGIRHASGSIVYKGQDTLQASDRTLRRLRGGERPDGIQAAGPGTDLRGRFLDPKSGPEPNPRKRLTDRGSFPA